MSAFIPELPGCLRLIESNRSAIVMTDSNRITTFLGTLSAEFGERTAVVMAGSGATLTFSQLEDRSLRIARLLEQLGLEAGDHVAMLMENELDVFPVAWAAQRSGLLYTPVNWHLSAEEAGYIVDNCGARILVYSPALSELAGFVLERAPKVERAFMSADGEPLPGTSSLTASAAGLSGAPRRGEIEGHPMLYSSGTTGRPKGIVPALEHSQFGAGLAIDTMMAGLFGFGPDSVYLSTGPLYHAAPLAWSMGASRNGGTIVVMESFDPEQVLRLVETHKVTHGQFVPTMFVRMLKLPEQVRTRYDMSSVEQVIHAAAPCPPEVKQAIIDWFGPVVTEYYAGSEVNGFCVITTPEWLEHRGSVGRPVLGEVHICDSEGEELASGEIGEVWFSGTRRFDYHGDPEKTAEAFNQHGWSTLGDLGYVDEDGYLYLSDRRTDLIISGGVNVYPREVEDLLCLHPEIADVAVIGVPDADLGARVHAVIELREDVAASEEVEQRLTAYLRGHIATFKAPRSYTFQAIPRLPSGKILRRLLLEQHAVPETTTAQ